MNGSENVRDKRGPGALDARNDRGHSRVLTRPPELPGWLTGRSYLAVCAAWCLCGSLALIAWFAVVGSGAPGASARQLAPLVRVFIATNCGAMLLLWLRRAR